MNEKNKCQVTPYGFVYGSMRVERWGREKGHSLVFITTPKHDTGDIQIATTASGKIRIWVYGQELELPKKREAKKK